MAITTQTRSVCDVPTVTQHTVEVHLERQAKGQWTDKLDMLGGGGINVCTKIPKPGLPQTCRQTLHGCISGTWRVRVLVEWMLYDIKGDEKHGSFTVPEMYRREIKCPGPKGNQ